MIDTSKIITAEMKAAKALEEATQQAIDARLKELRDTDWTELPDAPPQIKGKFTAYRQALRDMTINQNWSDDPKLVIDTIIAGKPL